MWTSCVYLESKHGTQVHSCVGGHDCQCVGGVDITGLCLPESLARAVLVESQLHTLVNETIEHHSICEEEDIGIEL